MDYYIVRYMGTVKKKERLILIGILILLIIINYGFINGVLEKKISGDEAILIEVERVIDGDTVVFNGTSMRLLGINSPEKGELYSGEAQEYLEGLVLNKTVVLKKRGKDRYYRELVYLFNTRESININLELVEKGYANFYFPSGKDEYYKDFVEAWEKCLKNGENLCEMSEDSCSDCIVLEEFGYDKDAILYNMCEETCNLEGWSIKDEGRKKFVFEDFSLESGEGAQITSKAFDVDYVWTKSGDSIFLRDSEGKLVLWDTY